MNRSEQLNYCKLCKLKEYNTALGIVCGLTGNKASFETSCTYFDPDQRLIQKQQKEQIFIKEAKKGRDKALKLIIPLFLLSLLSRISMFMIYGISYYYEIMGSALAITLELYLYAAILQGKQRASYILTVILFFSALFGIINFITEIPHNLFALVSLIPIGLWGYIIYFLNFNKQFSIFRNLKTKYI